MLYACAITPMTQRTSGTPPPTLSWDLLVRAWLTPTDSETPDSPTQRERIPLISENVTDVDYLLLERDEKLDGELPADWPAASLKVHRRQEDMEALRVLPPTHLIGAVEALPLIERFSARMADRGALYNVDEDVYFVIGDPLSGLLSGPGTACGYYLVGTSPNPLPSAAVTRIARVEGYRRRPGLARGTTGSASPLDLLAGRGAPACTHPVRGDRHRVPGKHLRRPGRRLDLVFPHHEMSASHARVALAAAEGAFARVYVHAGMVNYHGEKMSKSLGNLVFVSRLVADGVDPMAIRMALLAHHYRSDWEWTDAVLGDADARLARWRAALARAEAAVEFGAPGMRPASSAEMVLAGVRARLRDDLDAPGALAVVDRWADALLAEPPTRITSGDLAGARLVQATVDALLGIRL